MTIVKLQDIKSTHRNPLHSYTLITPVPGILQARTLEWVAISFSNAWKWKVKVKLLSRVGLLATPRTAAHQALPSMGFARQENWTGLPFPSPGDLPGSGIEPLSPALAGRFFTTKPPGKPYSTYNSLHLLIPHSHSIPPSQFPSLETTSLSTSYCF